MAAGTSKDSVLEKLSRNHLECSICEERYSQPKILACLHSFCQICIEKYYYARYAGTNKIPCPVCRQETVVPEQGISALKTNFFITSLMADIDLQRQVEKDTPTCGICQKAKEASQRCLDCSKNICSACLQAHQQFPDLSSHTVATVKDILKGKVAGRKRKHPDVPSCDKHPGEVKRFFCEKCDVLICRDCTVVDHPRSAGHHYSDLNDASLGRRQTLKASIQTLEQNKARLKESVTATDDIKATLTQNCAASKKEIQDSAEQMRAKIKIDEDFFVGEIETLKKDRMEKLHAHSEELHTLLKRCDHSAKTATDIIDTASNADFLSLYPEIKKDLQVLGKAPSQVDGELSYLKFQQNKTADGISLGKLVTKSMRTSQSWPAIQTGLAIPTDFKFNSRFRFVTSSGSSGSGMY
ncbi:E3 ubiquitin-protein ligase TRIM56-like [Patiria miniata]|uniref:Uncharacterized protein n=1 Tax=Patiria miniata TaxID=46514 RepID=A0A914AQS8_PATMI|nr:E3 ubiquitin-protein ligase TRIM56-like [Patiria miniata]